MFGLGGAEILIILVIALVVFGGPAVIGFWLGYQTGKKSSFEGQSGPTGTDDSVNTPAEEESTDD